jgi:hypothetical protein
MRKRYEIIEMRQLGVVNGEGLFFVTYTVFGADGSESHAESHPIYARDELEAFMYWDRRLMRDFEGAE